MNGPQEHEGCTLTQVRKREGGNMGGAVCSYSPCISATELSQSVKLSQTENGAGLLFVRCLCLTIKNNTTICEYEWNNEGGLDRSAGELIHAINKIKCYVAELSQTQLLLDKLGGRLGKQRLWGCFYSRGCVDTCKDVLIPHPSMWSCGASHSCEKHESLLYFVSDKGCCTEKRTGSKVLKALSALSVFACAHRHEI